MANELKDIAIEEISAVDRPANKGARIVLLKRDGQDDDRTSLVIRLAEELGLSAPNISRGDDMTDVEKRMKALADELAKLHKTREVEQAVAKVEKALAQAAEADDVAKALDAVEAEIAKLEADDTVKAELAKALKTAREADAATAKAAGEFKAFRALLPASMAKVFDDMDDDERRLFMGKFGKVEKVEDEIVKAELETQKAENAKLQKRLDTLEADANLAKARDEVKDLDGYVPQDFAETLVKLHKVDTDAADAMLKSVRAMAEQARQAGIFSVIGKDGEGDASAEGKIDKAVKKLREADPKLTPEAAMTKALEDDPQLYAAYNDEHVKSARGQGR